MRHDPAQKDRATDLGVVRINNDVIASIAAIAATEVKGVYRMGGGQIKGRFLDMISGKFSSKGVRIATGDGDVKLSISVVVEYGVDIPRIADEVQESVKRAVEKMTGLLLSEVDVVVEGVAVRSGGKRNGA